MPREASTTRCSGRARACGAGRRRPQPPPARRIPAPRACRPRTDRDRQRPGHPRTGRKERRLVAEARRLARRAAGGHALGGPHPAAVAPREDPGRTPRSSRASTSQATRGVFPVPPTVRFPTPMHGTGRRRDARVPRSKSRLRAATQRPYGQAAARRSECRRAGTPGVGYQAPRAGHRGSGPSPRLPGAAEQAPHRIERLLHGAAERCRHLGGPSPAAVRAASSFRSIRHRATNSSAPAAQNPPPAAIRARPSSLKWLKSSPKITGTRRTPARGDCARRARPMSRPTQATCAAP